MVIFFGFFLFAVQLYCIGWAISMKETVLQDMDLSDSCHFFTVTESETQW